MCRDLVVFSGDVTTPKRLKVAALATVNEHTGEAEAAVLANNRSDDVAIAESPELPVANFPGAVAVRDADEASVDVRADDEVPVAVRADDEVPVAVRADDGVPVAVRDATEASTADRDATEASIAVRDAIEASIAVRNATEAPVDV